MKRLRIPILILISALLLTALSCGRADEPMSATYYEYFDTVCYIRSYADESEESFSENCAEVEALLKEYHRLFDIYHEYDGMNNLCTVNLNAGISPVKVDRRLTEFLLYAKEMYALTDGEINIAMGSVLSLWHGCRESAAKTPENAALPDGAELSEAAKHISIDSIVIDESASTVYISDTQTSIDVGAIGKGYAAERAAELLQQRGVSSYVLNLGGNLRAVGSKPNGDGWVTGITDPSAPSSNAFAARIILSDSSCVTSGSYERCFTVGGKEYHHIIDKDTLFPSEHFVSVTVITRDSALADALSTALFCMTYEDGLALCTNIGSVDAIWIKKDGSILSTEGVNEFLIK